MKISKVEIGNNQSQLQKSIEFITKVVKKQIGHSNQDYKIKTRLTQPLEYPKETLNYDYDDSDREKDNVKTVKVQTKTQIKNIKTEIKMNIQKKKLFGYRKPRQEVEKLAYPPHFQMVPLKGQKNSELMTVFQNEGKKIIKRMMKKYKQDQNAYLSRAPAINKITYISQIQKKLSNAYIKSKFIQFGGLLCMERWIDTNRISGTQYEPSITIKLGILKILKSMCLTPEELNTSQNLMKIINKNKHSQLYDLRQSATSLIDQWEYSIMNMNKQQKKLK